MFNLARKKKKAQKRAHRHKEHIHTNAALSRYQKICPIIGKSSYTAK
jgi:hypothetical protein